MSVTPEQREQGIAILWAANYGGLTAEYFPSDLGDVASDVDALIAAGWAPKAGA